LVPGREIRKSVVLVTAPAFWHVIGRFFPCTAGRLLPGCGKDRSAVTKRLGSTGLQRARRIFLVYSYRFFSPLVGKTASNFHVIVEHSTFTTKPPNGGLQSET